MATSDAFANLLAYIKKEADTLKVLQRNSLKECLLTGKASWKHEGDSERFKHYKIYLMLEKKMSAEQKQVIEEWERRNCVHWRPAFRNFYSVAEQHLEEMKALRKATLSAEVRLMSSFVGRFSGSHHQKRAQASSLKLDEPLQNLYHSSKKDTHRDY